MEYCKLQICCIIIVLYIAFNYCIESRNMKKKEKMTLFEGILIVSIISLISDGMTAYTVNHLDTIPDWFNRLIHLVFLVSLDVVIFAIFLYMLVVTEGFPKNRKKVFLLYSPLFLNIFILICNIGSLEFRKGQRTNYSMGISVYTCFAMVGIYILLTIAIFLKRWRYIERHKRAGITAYLLAISCVSGYQMFVPEALITSLGVTLLVLGVYINLENPAFRELSGYHQEMVMGFATLVESRDDNTGGHIRRTSRYVELLAKELRHRGYYREILTKDYIKNLLMAAPMHDVGKISVPDAILQKPGKLTDEEFAIMKLHTVNGGKIIRETFGNLGNAEYEDMAYKVAYYHHEKWNGRGYPEGIEGTQIPLAARIMAIADVFDAVSEKRCYRDAMPLEKCFDIIREGSGRDFEPLLVEVFLDIREQVEAIHREYQITQK